jgi:hypothetical protein
MSSHFKLPFINPFRFVKYGVEDAVHFDDDWSCSLRAHYERDVRYKQKWVKSKTTKLQCESSIYPDNLIVYNVNRAVVYNYMWTPVFVGVNYTIYECEVDFSSLADGVYFLYQFVGFNTSLEWELISEPIDVRASWSNTLQITYKHSYNDYDVAWTTGIEMLFIIEAGIKELTPERDRTAHISQTADVTTLWGVPSRSFKLLVGLAPGVAEWVIDLLNRIFLCDYISINGMRYQNPEGAKWEIQRVKGYPLVGAQIDIVPEFNNMSHEFADATEIAAGIVTAYNIETAFFGPGALVPITDIEEQS